ncbi:MAG: hypothetical protein CMF98_03625 [Candidatus Marinimicrobia bacterium]|nr:hypothetical protein [Candidatus Neomarinimicrobiota bacterium]OUW50572.1 MAG: hypothetical protein CBD50_02220 [bacterium TMED190]|tara:strand:+ start:126447 stop:130307 length:3861 start_codon:yes stop_codon:yes gene_type:complete
MKRRNKAILLLLIILALLFGSVAYIVISPNKWTKEIVNYINQSLIKDNSWNLSLGDINGSLFSDIELKDIYFRNQDGTISLFSESVKLNLDYSSIFTGSWGLSNLFFNNVLLSIDSKNEQKLDDINFIGRLAKKELKSKKIAISNSSLILKNKNTENIYKFETDGKLISQNDVLSFEINNFFAKDYYSDNIINLNRGKVRLSSDNISLRNINGKFNQHTISLNGVRNFNLKKNSNFWVQINDLKIKKSISEKIKSDSLAFIDLNIDYLNDKIKIDGSINEVSSSKKIALFSTNISQKINGFNFENVIFQIKNSNLNGTGFLNFNKKLDFNLKIENFDLNTFDFVSDDSKINGLIDLNIRFNDFYKVEKVESKISLQNNNFGSDNFFSSFGKVNYENSQIFLNDPFIFNVGSGSFSLFGDYNLAKEHLNLEMTLNEVELDNFSDLLDISYLPKSKINGSMHLSGLIDNPSIRGNLNFKNIKSKNYTLGNLTSTFSLNSINNSRDGSLFLNGKNINFQNINYEDLEMNFYFLADTIYIAKANLSTKKENTIFSGEIINFNKLNIEQLRSNINGQQIHILEPLRISFENNKFNLGPSKFKVNDGNMEIYAKFKFQQILEGNLDVNNLEIDIINSFLKDEIPVSGILNGKLEAKHINNKINIDGKIEIGNGNYEDFIFKNLITDFSLHENQFYLEKLKIYSDKELKLDLSGYYNMIDSTKDLFKLNQNSEIDFSAYFNNFDLSSFSDFLPDWWNINGFITGSSILSGKLDSSNLKFSLNLKNPTFSLLNADELNISGTYNDKRLFFENIIGYTKKGQYYAEGYIPIDLDIISENKNILILNDPVNLKIHGKSNSLELITPYFSDVDSLNGNINFELTLNGTLNKLIRNGFINLSNGNLFYSHLDLPLSGLNGYAILKENMFIINNLTATSTIPEDTNWGKDLRYNISKVSGGRIFKNKMTNEIQNNLSLTGTMDMTSFFNPNLAFILNGKNIYFRTLLGEIEAIGDVNLAITGKDTINISGDLIPDEAVLRMEFYDENISNRQISNNGTSINYKLNIPINDNLFIQNSQIDAEVSGNMSIFKNGTEPYRYAGELEVVDGKFYYYSDVFDVQDGNLIFDPTQLNPKLNINASTTISGEQILVNLSGFLDDPVLILEHSDNFFSQEDLLQLLTLQKTFNGTADELGRQSAFIFGKFLENEIEKNISRSNPIFNEFDIEGSSAIIDPSNSSEVAVKLGTRVTSNLSLSYKRSFSLLKNNELGVEYRLNRNVSLVASYDEDGQVRLKYRRKYKF